MRKDSSLEKACTTCWKWPSVGLVYLFVTLTPVAQTLLMHLQAQYTLEIHHAALSPSPAALTTPPRPAFLASAGCHRFHEREVLPRPTAPATSRSHTLSLRADTSCGTFIVLSPQPCQSGSLAAVDNTGGMVSSFLTQGPSLVESARSSMREMRKMQKKERGLSTETVVPSDSRWCPKRPAPRREDVTSVQQGQRQNCRRCSATQSLVQDRPGVR